MKKIILICIMVSLCAVASAGPKLYEVVRNPDKCMGKEVTWRGVVRRVKINDGKTTLKCYYRPFGASDRIVRDSKYFQAYYNGEMNKYIYPKTLIKIKGTVDGMYDENTPRIKINKYWRLKDLD